MALKALIFDVDGTLAETEETHRLALNETFAAFGLPWVWDQATYRRLLNVMGGKERIRHYVAFDHPPMGDAALAALPALHAAKNARYAALIAAGGITLRPGVERLIRESRSAGLKLGIATTTSVSNVEALLAATLGSEGRGLFDCVAAGDQVGQKKPAPDIFNLALRELGVEPDEAIAFEDTVYGLKAATAAGLRSVVTPSFYTDDQDFSGAAAVFDTLGEPDLPARHISGAGADDSMVTVAMLRSLAA
ncbi:HAD-IA family hydrolase [Hansschlegelia quercus]|uniref:HAD family hydrolase n=1 Tax=Hansschlegelia quercus TaxID=2528245 RepID=A0A4Q9GMZ1_9HYPH|nr:HAD-IA family hydrolase [Hansschlegelia quercus]TBN54535.1 HAD family hydrolase [Hansschlegelia quercus]